MKAFKVDEDGVVEVEGAEADLLREEIVWTCFELDPAHDVWIDDEGLMAPHATVATIGATPHVPLPAFIMGVDGERTVSATLTLEEVTALVSIGGSI